MKAARHMPLKPGKYEASGVRDKLLRTGLTLFVRAILRTRAGRGPKLVHRIHQLELHVVLCLDAVWVNNVSN
jgi:hypothetical protein